jgi:hypothetical protein
MASSLLRVRGGLLKSLNVRYSRRSILPLLPQRNARRRHRRITPASTMNPSKWPLPWTSLQEDLLVEVFSRKVNLPLSLTEKGVLGAWMYSWTLNSFTPRQPIWTTSRADRSCYCWDSNFGSSAVQIVVIRCIDWAFGSHFHYHNQYFASHWPRGLRRKLSSLVHTLGYWVRTPVVVWMSVCAYSV